MPGTVLVTLVGGCSSLGSKRIEREVQADNVGPGVAKDTQIRFINILSNEFVHFVCGDPPRLRDARNLQLGIARADVGSEPLPEAVTASAGTESSALKPFSAR